MRVVYWLVFATGLIVAVRPAMAVPVTYVESGLLSGTLGTNAFTNALLTFSFIGDTDNVVNMSPYYLNTVGTSTVSIAGLGTATFTSQSFGALSQGLGSQVPAAGFYDASSLFGIVTTGAAFDSYMLNTAIGPVTGQLTTNGNFPTSTSRGDLVINNNTSIMTFQAITTPSVPEPNGIVLLLTGTLGVCAAARRRLSCRSSHD